MIDNHSYGQWPNGTNLTKEQLAVSWSAILQALALKGLDIKTEYRVLIELQNEPYFINDLVQYNETIETIRDLGYKNKLILGLSAGQNAAKFSGYSYYSGLGSQVDGFNSYSGGTPTDSLSNLAVTLHQYCDNGNTGLDYSNQLSLNTFKTVCPVGNINDAITMAASINCDLILGEFGWPGTNQNPHPPGNDGALNFNYIFDTIVLKTSNLPDSSTYKNKTTSYNLLTQSSGKFLGFTGWPIVPHGNRTLNYIGTDQLENCYNNYIGGT